MRPLKEYDHESILSDELLEEVIFEQDEIKKARLLISIEDYIDEYIEPSHKGTHDKFKKLVRAYRKVDKVIEEQNKHPQKLQDNYTNFGYFENGMEYYCGQWIADQDGVRTYNFIGEVLACYHPILPIKRLKNLETGEEQIELAYRRNNKWYTQKVAKTIISSASQITKLSAFGIAVTSENAKYLVKYLSDIENMNEHIIDIQSSTSKLGWHKEDFIPYDDSITFDGDTRFRNLFDAVHERGNYDVWLDHMRTLRATHKKEIKFMLAAAFASPLIERLGVLPFMVDLWGETEGGKTVSLMLSASVWANPDESQYIGDFKTTDVALEAKADMLNNLPMLLDDTSKVSGRIRDNFEGVVYDLCSGKGKSRSNKDLGMNRENHWRNCIITNGERPLSSYVSQGGAINRILEVECQEHIYDDPQNTAEILKKNYGYAGRLFVEILKDYNRDELLAIHQEFCAELMADDKMQKQAISLATLLTADKLATDYIFKDSAYITLDEARETLVDRSEVSDNQRCYEYLLDKIAMNHIRFDAETNCEKWGILEDGYAIIYSSAFDNLCKEKGFSKKSFLSWASRKHLIDTQGNRDTKVKKINGKTYRCICLQIEDEFEDITEQSELPFD